MQGLGRRMPWTFAALVIAGLSLIGIPGTAGFISKWYLINAALDQPSVFVHRDYHSRNLMVTEPNPGILDFQDAVFGPVSYDVVSLFRDAFVSWDEERVLDWVIRYWEKARKAKLPVREDFGEFYKTMGGGDMSHDFLYDVCRTIYKGKDT